MYGNKWICFDQNEFQSNLWTNFISTRYSGMSLSGEGKQNLYLFALWVNCYRNHDVYCALMLYMYTYLFVLNLTILNSWVSLYSLMSTTLPKEWRKTGQQTSLIFKIHHSKISSLENFLKFTSLDHLGPTQVKYIDF